MPSGAGVCVCARARALLAVLRGVLELYPVCVSLATVHWGGRGHYAVELQVAGLSGWFLEIRVHFGRVVVCINPNPDGHLHPASIHC